MVTRHGHRKLYFITQQQMDSAIAFLLSALGLKSRLDQYRMGRQLPSIGVGLKRRVKHRLRRTAHDLIAISKKAEASHVS